MDILHGQRGPIRGPHRALVLFPCESARGFLPSITPEYEVSEGSSPKNGSLWLFRSQQEARQSLTTSECLSLSADGFPFLDITRLIVIKSGVFFCSGVATEL